MVQIFDIPLYGLNILIYKLNYCCFFFFMKMTNLKVKLNFKSNEKRNVHNYELFIK